MDGFIWHALPPQEPPPVPTADCYNFGDVYETSCPGEGEGTGGGVEAGEGNGMEVRLLPIPQPGRQPGQPGEAIPTQTPGSTGQDPEPPTEEGEPERPTQGVGSAPPEAETPGDDDSDGTKPPVGAGSGEPDAGEQAGSPEQLDNGTPSSDQQNPEQTTPSQPPSDEQDQD